MSSLRKQARPLQKGLAQGQRRGKKGRIRKALAASVTVFAFGTMTLLAQGTDTLSRAQVVTPGGPQSCPVLLVTFNQDLAVSNQELSDGGQTLTVRLSDKLSPTARQSGTERIETRPSLEIPGLGTAFVTLDMSGDQPVMNIRFSAAPKQAVVTQAGTRSVIVALYGATETCATAPAPQTAATDTALPETTATDTVAADAEAGQLLKDARTAITATNYDQAVQVLTKLLAMPANSYSADAQELLGLVRERNGQMAHAKAEYELYLKTYPDGAGADRVRQRLAGLETAQAAPPTALREAGPGTVYDTTTMPATDNGQVRITSIPRRNESFPPLRPQPGATGRGSRGRAGEGPIKLGADGKPATADDPPRIIFSSYYYWNQSSTLITELESRNTESESDIQQNALILSFDISDDFEKNGKTYSYRFSGDYIQDFTGSDNSRLNMSRFYGELAMGLDGPSVAVGRQSWNDDASLGRYDGVRLRYSVNDDLRVTGIAGLAVNRKSDAMFGSSDKVFGVTADILSFGEDTELTAYAITQFSGNYTDRMVIGAEGSYSNDNNSVYGLVEYDLSFGKIGTARANWSHRLKDRSSFTLTAEYDHTPNLSLNSALQGQLVTTLDELAADFTVDEMRSLALDRTAEIFTLAGSWQKPLNEKWQFSVDASAYYQTGMPSSGGVEAVEAPGLAFFSSAQLVGTGVLVPNDVFSVSLRAASDVSSQLFMLDGYWRYNVSDKLRLKPRIKLAHRTFANGSGTEDFAIPSVTLDYEFNDNNSFELEVGTRLSTRDTPGITEESNGPYLVAGFTKQF